MQEASGSEMFCYCLRKKQATVVAEWRSSRDADLDAFLKRTGIGTVCTSCRSMAVELLSKTSRDGGGAGVQQEVIYSDRHFQQRPFFARIKRHIGQAVRRQIGMRSLSYQTLWWQGEGTETALTLVNEFHPQFPRGAIDLVATVRVYDAAGALRNERRMLLPHPAVRVFSMREMLGDVGKEEVFGLVDVRYEPRRAWRDARHWRIGSARPYVTYTVDGRSASVHEKSVWFDTETVIPGIAGTTERGTTLRMANVSDRAGHIVVTLRGTTVQEEHRLACGPFASVAYIVPETVGGEAVQSLALRADITITGYQFLTNPRSGFFSVQHLVKEGR